MKESPEAAWDFELDNSAGIDQAYGRDEHVGLVALVSAARGSGLARFYPFTSMGRLCFSTGPRWWMGDGEPVPAFVTVNPEDGYVVWRGSPYVHPAEVALVTRSAIEAVAGLERVLGLHDSV
ncbi:hypothetical protein GCM10018790_64420 [Kitasatospora xanthocidica]|uniref:hypothetical protein n=1 Tax=Kitasatospora xanthocidica TaxID=83382 RepID=UPI0016781557|nr:hypothetical protein [Kitasatospora xanthocidica]GHF77422.1 hypothetical protein GCM10018790_64420 [Kitasatospora xanthocidica]